MYLTSDLHFFHKNVLRFCPETRPFADTDEMNQFLVDKWNEKAVKPNTKMFHLGDLSFGKPGQTREIVSQLQGDITFINGNHDYDKNKEVLREFGEVVDYKKVNYQGKKFILFHYPILEWDSKHHGSIHCYGHLHQNTIPEKYGLGKAMNVGWDAIGKIIHFDEVIEIMENIPVGFCSHK